MHVLLLMKTTKEICKANGGDWKKGQCDFDTDDEDKADEYTDDVNAKWQSNEEEAEREDDAEDNKRFNDDDEKYTVKSMNGDVKVTRYYDDKDDAEEAYKDLDRDELTHSDKSYSDWEYDDEEHPALK